MTWRPIPDSHYAASVSGQIRRSAAGRGTRVGKVLKQYLTGNGYLVVYLWKNNQQKRRYVHHLVLEAFVGKKELGKAMTDWQVNHMDFDKTNNSLENIEYVRRSENVAHASRHDRFKVGPKLNMEKAKDIRRKVSEGRKQKDVAAEYEVSTGMISQIVHNKTWVPA